MLSAPFALPAGEKGASSKSKAGFVYHRKASPQCAMHAAFTVRHMPYGHRSALHRPSHRASSTVRHMAYGGTIAHRFHSDAASSVVKAHFIPPCYIMGDTFGGSDSLLNYIMCSPYDSISQPFAPCFTSPRPCMTEGPLWVASFDERDAPLEGTPRCVQKCSAVRWRMKCSSMANAVLCEDR